MPSFFPTTGLYAITPTDSRTPKQMVPAVAAAISGGAKVVQFRSKNLTDSTSTAKSLLLLCRATKIPLIINDNIELAKSIGADGVHLGQHDENIADARAYLGVNAIIGISCYNSVAKAKEAENAGADYVAFGRFFPSQTKPNAPIAELSTLSAAKSKINIPIVAIGGILPSNGKLLLQAGANILAVIGGLFDPHDPEQSARNYQKLFE